MINIKTDEWVNKFNRYVQVNPLVASYWMQYLKDELSEKEMYVRIISSLIDENDSLRDRLITSMQRQKP